MRMAKFILTKTYLLSNTIFNSNNFDTNGLRTDIIHYINKLRGKKIFETTYFISWDLPYKDVYDEIEYNFKTLLENNKLTDKVDVKLGIFEIRNKNYWIGSL